MKSVSQKTYILSATVVCALAMSLVDGIIQPSYAVKSAVKVVLFLLVPLVYFGVFRQWGALKALFLPKKKDIAISLGLGMAAYVLIVAGFALINSVLHLNDTILKLTAMNGVTAENFGGIALYIPIVNSLMEEFLFRGFAFCLLKQHTSRRFAYLFSAVVFACYHFGMVAGTGEVLIWILAMAALVIAGLILNFLNEKSGSILTSWLLHMFANLAINTIALKLFGML